MQLEWFRQHKKFVYWVLLPIVGAGMAFFGASEALERSRSGSGTGPSVTYRAGGADRWMTPSEVIDLRLDLTHYSARGSYASSDDAARHMIAYHMAVDSGFEIGPEEKKEMLREAVKRQIQMREAGADPKATEAVYRKLLKEIEMSPAKFEKMTHQYSVASKLHAFIFGQSKASDAQLFIEYSKEKETARIRFLELKSEDFLEKATAPSEEKIKTFYDENKEVKAGPVHKMLYNAPRISADVMHLNTEKLLADLKPTEDDLKRFYNAYKHIYWKEAVDPTKPPPVPGEEKFKPMETVKAEVEAKWRDDQKVNRPHSRMSELRVALEKDEKAYNEEQAKKPEAERKPFDMAEWAKKNDLTHWTTKELTEEEFRAGKKELNAPDAAWIEQLFPMTRESRNARIDEINKKRFNELSFPQPLEHAKPEKGMVVYRKKTFVPEAVKKLEDAKAAIADHLKIQDAVDLARKEAEKIQKDWVDGKNLKDLNTLDELVATHESTHPLAYEFRDKPVTVGNVLPVAEGAADDKKPENMHRRFYIGIPVERKLPTWTTFDKDTTWDRDRNRSMVAQSDQQFTSVSLMRQMKDMGKVVGNMKDPPLNQNYRDNGMPDE